VQKQVHPRPRSALHTRLRASTEERGKRAREKRRKKKRGERERRLWKLDSKPLQITYQSKNSLCNSQIQ
jgi:hypothetical protein